MEGDAFNEVELVEVEGPEVMRGGGVEVAMTAAVHVWSFRGNGALG